MMNSIMAKRHTDSANTPSNQLNENNMSFLSSDDDRWMPMTPIMAKNLSQSIHFNRFLLLMWCII